ncbi:SAM-dependent methyltransferase [Agathobacter rectalis]|uniref:SAM-dependent methyltransferase n=1 Tax=Agathobacter rectalis TaxID=39491 RepID=UPI0027D32FAA|nr:SAM-dependent methyltransferase [Agathobacter rectalis]
MDKQIERAGDDNKNNIGVLYGIGVGPGDPELMTLKAINTIKACDIIAIPAVSKEECYAYSIVQSFCAAAARLGISLGEMMDEIHIIPASYDVRDTVGYGGTCVYMKSGKKLAELIEVLRTGDAIRKKKMTVYGVTNCGMESEHVYMGLDELTEAKGYLTIVIVKYS